MKLIKFTFVSVLFASVFSAVAAVDENLYVPLDRPLRPIGSGKVVEVVEFFWYGCPHCYAAEPVVDSIKKALPKGSVFIKIPGVANPRWEIEAGLYYALEVLNVLKFAHTKIFDAIHRTGELRRHVGRSIDGYYSFLASNAGIERGRLEKAYTSFGVRGKVGRARSIGEEYGIRGVPALFVAGKYRVTRLESSRIKDITDTVVSLVKREIDKSK